jgi:competence protein ComEC
MQGFRTVCLLDQLFLSRAGAPSADDPKLAANGKIRLAVYGNAENLDPGTRITFTGRIRAFRNFNNPGAFDYVRYMRFQGTWGNAYVSGKNLDVEPASPRLKDSMTDVRKKIAAHIDRSAAGGANAILHALILGNRAKISNDLRDTFNRAGISHILAISGLHVGIVAAFSFFMFSRVLSFFPFFLRRAWTRKGAAILSVLPVLVYGTLAGMSPSTQRAVVMATVFLLTFLVSREHDLINTISIAALVILIIHPPSLFSISFQLSFAAVLSIVYGTMKLIAIRKTVAAPENVRSPLAAAEASIGMFIIVSGLAILGTAPLTMHYFNQISFMGIFSNLIFIPVIGFFVVPAGLFSVLMLLPLWPTAASWGLEISAFVLTLANGWIHWISNLPWAAIKTVTPSLIEMLCF